MAESFIDFALVAIILAGLAVATLILLFMHSKRMRRLLPKCCGNSGAKTEDLETGIAPKRTTIRVVKSAPMTPLGITPASSGFPKVPLRRTRTNPPDEPETPSRQFVFIYPKKLSYQCDQSTFVSTLQSGSTKSSWLPTNRRNSQ